jgi:hypothetical protein
MTISNEQLLIDISLTEREYDAYYNISRGFYELCWLPENSESSKNLNLSYYHKYISLMNSCYKFLLELRKLKDQRGIE